MADSLEQRMQEFIDAWGMKVVDSANIAADAAVNYSSGQSTELQPNFKAKVFADGSVRFVLTMEKYYKYIDGGVNGAKKNTGGKYTFSDKPIPYKAIKNFIERRGISPAQSIKGQRRTESVKGKGKLSKKLRKTLKQITHEQNLNNTIFAMRESIRQNGFKPRPFVSKIITPELMKELNEGIAKIIGEQFIIDLKTL